MGKTPNYGRESHEFCLRCPNAELRLIPESPVGRMFFECVGCGRRYDKGPGESLHDAWLSPITLALFGVIFEQAPEDFALATAVDLHKTQTADQIDILIADIQEELSHPKQRVSQMHRFLYPDEMRLRGFLESVAEELKRL